MVRHRWSKAACLVAILFHLTGCGWWGDDQQDEIDDVFPELGVATELPEGDQLDAAAETSELPEPNFHVGDRYPLLKTVQQTLTQETGGIAATSRSELNVRIVLSVEEVRDRRTRVGVQYNRVEFSQDVAGETLVYDSRQPRSQIPEAVRPYAGLVRNGFSFWLGPDNQVDELVGFEDFVKRCVRNVAPARQAALLAELTAFQGEDGVIHFVDDSIGLLPHTVGETELTAGASWDRTQQVMQPFPLNMRTKYTVQNVDDHVAEIDILGTISQGTTAAPRPDSGVSLTIRDGHAYGRCTIDRVTGLPIRSEVVRLLTMRVQLPGGEEFEQRKEIVTTIRALPPQEMADAAGPGGHPQGMHSTRELGFEAGVVPAAAYETRTEAHQGFAPRGTYPTGTQGEPVRRFD